MLAQNKIFGNIVFVHEIDLFQEKALGWGTRGPEGRLLLQARPSGPLGQIYPHVTLSRQRRVKMSFASPYMDLTCLNITFSLGRLPSDELS